MEARHDLYLVYGTAYLSYDFNVDCAGTIVGSNSIHNANNVALHEPDIFGMTIPLSHIQKMLNKIHDIGPCVHIVLQSLVRTTHRNKLPRTKVAYSLELLKNARMQIFVHISVLESILGGFLGGRDRGVEVLQLVDKAHTHFERVGHGDVLKINDKFT